MFSGTFWHGWANLCDIVWILFFFQTEYFERSHLYLYRTSVNWSLFSGCFWFNYTVGIMGHCTGINAISHNGVFFYCCSLNNSVKWEETGPLIDRSTDPIIVLVACLSELIEVIRGAGNWPTISFLSPAPCKWRPNIIIGYLMIHGVVFFSSGPHVCEGKQRETSTRYAARCQPGGQCTHAGQVDDWPSHSPAPACVVSL